MEPGAGPRHTYPLSAGLNTLTTPTAKRRAAREKHRKRETVKIAGKADQVNFAPAARRAELTKHGIFHRKIRTSRRFNAP